MIKQSKLFLAMISLAGLFFGSCSSNENKPMLEGKINVTEPTELTFVYDINGDVYADDIMTDSLGSFVYNPEIPTNSADISIYTGHDVYGAFIEKGKNTVMEIDGVNVAFTGDNVDRNEFNNAYEQAYSIWKFKPTPDKPFEYNAWMSNIESGYNSASEKLASVKDADVRNVYSIKNEARKKYYTIQALSMESRNLEGDEAAAMKAEADSLVATIDPNADESRLSGLINYWYNNANLYQYATTGDAYSTMGRMFVVVDSVLTNEANKKNLYSTIGSMFFAFQPSDSVVEVFMETIKPYIANAPQLQKNFQEIIDQRAAVMKDGDMLPCDAVLIAPDGTKTTLFDQLQGKVVYIDFWATWCGPCCREIPYMEKVVERFKDNDQIRFISISCDEDRDAWLKKIEKDNPQWPQFVFDQKSHKEFGEAMQINGIPRFIIVAPDRRVISINAARPSDKEIDEKLNQAIASQK